MKKILEEVEILDVVLALIGSVIGALIGTLGTLKLLGVI